MREVLVGTHFELRAQKAKAHVAGSPARICIPVRISTRLFSRGLDCPDSTVQTSSPKFSQLGTSFGFRVGTFGTRRLLSEPEIHQFLQCCANTAARAQREGAEQREVFLNPQIPLLHRHQGRRQVICHFFPLTMTPALGSNSRAGGLMSIHDSSCQS
jgi:hypothetical protein